MRILQYFSLLVIILLSSCCSNPLNPDVREFENYSALIAEKHIPDTTRIDGIIRYQANFEMVETHVYKTTVRGTAVFSTENRENAFVESVWINNNNIEPSSSRYYSAFTLPANITSTRYRYNNYEGFSADTTLPTAVHTMFTGFEGLDTFSMRNGFTLGIIQSNPNTVYTIKLSGAFASTPIPTDSIPFLDTILLTRTNISTNAISFSTDELQALKPYSVYELLANSHQLDYDTLSNGKIIAYLSTVRTRLPFVLVP